jgi:hypothetical protein
MDSDYPFGIFKLFCSGSHLGITINIKNTKFVKDLPMIDAQFRFMFQNASSLKPLGQLKPNCPGMIIGRSSKRKVCRGPSNEHSCAVWL